MAESRKRVTVIANVSGVAPRAVVLGINSVVADHGWTLQLLTANEATGFFLRQWDPEIILLCDDGLAVLTPEDRAGRTVVAVATDLTHRGLPSVSPDDHAIGRIAAEYLLRRGMRSLAVHGIPEHLFSQRRTEGFIAEATGAGVMVEVIGNGQDFHESRRRWVHDLARTVSPATSPLGVLCCCDEWARHMSLDCWTHRVSVPERLAIVGVDNDDLLCELSTPPISSVIVPWREIGRHAAALAFKRIESPPDPASPPTLIQLAPTGVHTRRSTDILAVEDEDVRQALSVISQHASQPLSVAQLLRLVPADRRRLERAFRATTGRTMRAEIRRVHVEHAKNLLATSELPMPDIAEQCGFANASKLSQAFRREIGITPTEYRKQYRIRP